MIKNDSIYLDYAATTPVDPRVIEAMLPYFSHDFGNPSSTHRYGQHAEAAVEEARESIATILECDPKQILFTSGGTESDNLSLRGVAFARRHESGADHILISPVEHQAILATAIQLAELHHFTVEFLPVDSHGCVDPDEVRKRLRPNTSLVSVIYANNEIGTINPIADIGVICSEHGIPLHSDALQAAGYLEIRVHSLGINMLSLGAHKFYGPKGIGAFFIRTGTPLLPTQTGGEQEFGQRAGTLNVPLIVGMAEALKIARLERDETVSRLTSLRDRLISQTLSSIEDVQLTGHPTNRLPNHASFVFKGVDGNLLLNILDARGFACSSGSACKTGSPAPSEVLLAIGVDPEWALGSLRVTLGRWTTGEEVEAFCQVLPDAVRKARQLG